MEQVKKRLILILKVDFSLYFVLSISPIFENKNFVTVFPQRLMEAVSSGEK